MTVEKPIDIRHPDDVPLIARIALERRTRNIVCLPTTDPAEIAAARRLRADGIVTFVTEPRGMVIFPLLRDARKGAA